MSDRVLARCGRLDADGSESGFDKVLALRQTGSEPNVDLELTNITCSILTDISPLGRDLLDIAVYVYVLDSSVTRGGRYDVYGSRWSRDLTIRVPVRDVGAWNRLKSQLEKLLGYLTDDRFTFEFRPHPGDTGQRYLEFESTDRYRKADCVCLFSGGADSLAGALHQFDAGREPLLVSHRSAAPIDNRQKTLRNDLASCFPEWAWPHLSVWAHRRGLRATEHTQRSRSFLFLSLATVVANELGMEEAFIPENGIVSLNIPKLKQALGARASRSTQPRFIAGFEQLASDLLGRDLAIENPFLLRTKSEVLKVINGSGHPELLEASVSCVHTRGRTKAMPHCGECSQCVDRRFSSLAAGMESFDPGVRYQTDIFSDNLQGEGKKQFEAYVRAARRFQDLGQDEFVTEHRQVTDALGYLEGTAAQVAKQLYELHQRFARQTLDVLRAMIEKHAGPAAEGSHPPDGFLSLVSGSRLTQEPAEIYAENIIGILRKDLPLRFQSSDPTGERELQDAIEAALNSAGERLRREGPAVSYSVVETVPDFSSEEVRDDLYVEAKLVKDRDSLRYAVKSIGEASSYYVDAGAWALFIVYDTDRHIADDEGFATEFEKKGRVTVAVIR